MSAIGGIVHLQFAGRQRAIEGETTFEPGGVEREQSEDANGEAVGYTEKIVNGKMTGVTIFLVDGITPKSVQAIKDKPASISCPASGQRFRTDTFTCAKVYDVNLHKGTLKADFFWSGSMT